MVYQVYLVNGTNPKIQQWSDPMSRPAAYAYIKKWGGYWKDRGRDLRIMKKEVYNKRNHLYKMVLA